jgi:branched-chain amino acid transport system substrate-binding protein
MRSLTPQFLVSLFLFLLTIYSPFGPISAIAAEGKKTIGLSLPLSGPYQKLGEQMRFAAKLALEDYKKQNNSATIQLKIIDDECKAEQGKNAARQFVQAQVDIILGNLCYKSFSAAQEILAPKQIPTLSPTLRHPHHAQSRKDMAWQSFTFGGNRKIEISTTASIMLQRFYNKPYALIDDGSIEARNFIDAIRSIADARGITPIHVDNFRPLQPAQSALVRRLKKAGIKGAFVAGEANDVAIIARDIAAQGLDIELIGGEEMAILPFINESNELPTGIKNLFAIMRPDLLKLANAQNMITTLKSQSLEAEDYHLLGYALMQLAISALEEDNINDALSQRNFPTILGNIKFNDNGESSPYLYQLQQWQDDHFSTQINE